MTRLRQKLAKVRYEYSTRISQVYS